LAVSSLISQLLGPQFSISTHLKNYDLNVVHHAQEILQKTYFLLSKQIIYFHSGMSCVQSGTSDQPSIEIGKKVASTNLKINSSFPPTTTTSKSYDTFCTCGVYS
jgi:hypothetical protein